MLKLAETCLVGDGSFCLVVVPLVNRVCLLSFGGLQVSLRCAKHASKLLRT